MSKYFKRMNIHPALFIIPLLLFILIIFLYNKTIITEGYSVISYADAPGNDIGLLDVTDVSGNWLINQGQKLNNTDYSGKTCRNICDLLADCKGYLLNEDTSTTGTCLFKSDVTTTQQPNKNFNYYLNVK